MTTPRLLSIQTAPGSPTVCIRPLDTWPCRDEPMAWAWEKQVKYWPDFLSYSPPPSEPYIVVRVMSGRVVADLLEAGLADGEFVPLAMQDCPTLYFAFRPRGDIPMRYVDVAAKLGLTEPSVSTAPDYESYAGNAFVLGRGGKGGADHILSIPEVLALAKEKKWTGVGFTNVGGGLPIYECDARGKTREYPHPATSILDGYYVSEDVIAADLVRARELAAELQNSPDTPEWTRRSFEIVRKALVEAPHTLGYPMPESAKPRRVSKPDAPLIDPKAIKRLKLEGGGDLEGEIELGRPLFGSDTLSVTVSDSICDDDAPEVSFTEAEMKRRAKSALEKLEDRLPVIEAAINQLADSYEKSPADFRAILHNPGVFLCTVDMAEGERWAFTVEDELVTHFFEFDGDKLIETWAGD